MTKVPTAPTEREPSSRYLPTTSPPPQPAESVYKVLGSAEWLRAAYIQEIKMLAGWIPVEMKDHVFRLYLFPNKGHWSDWVIYFRLAGGEWTEEYALKFLKGAKNLPGDAKLVEFALCFPDRRIERFNEKGFKLVIKESNR